MTDDVQDGWHSPEDRKLMVRAVAKFSDQCEAPTLTAECPFFELTDSGDPACAEQCQDLIARYPGDLAHDEPLGLGAGLTATRRRPRRGPSDNEMAFDAGQATLEDEDRPLTEWRFSSLLTAARSLVFSPLGPQMPIGSVELAAEIQRRGVNGDLSLPMALAKDRVTAISIAFLASKVAFPDEADGMIANLTGDLEGWRAALNGIGGLVGPDQSFVTDEGQRALVGWYTGLSAADAMADIVPTVDDLRFGLEMELNRDLVAEARWMVERFTITYLQDWSSTSRAREWRFIHAQRSGCCPPGIMRQRAVDPQALAKALADEHCDRHDEEQSDEGQAWTATHFKSTAIAKLRNGQTEEAANVFRVLVELEPQDAEIRNNLGFCLIPNHPKEAVASLRESLAIGSPTPTLTQFNLALALHLSGEAAEANALVLRTLAEGSADEDSVFVWRVEADGLKFGPIHDLFGYGEELVSHMAQCEGACISA